jgi:hypothetical protein
VKPRSPISHSIGNYVVLFLFPFFFPMGPRAVTEEVKREDDIDKADRDSEGEDRHNHE